MDKIIADQLELYFKDYKGQMLWILLGFFILTIVIQYFSNITLTKKIEDFKNQLKKTEIKFSKHSELQIECLKNVYDKVVSFHFAYNSLIDPFFFSHETYKANIENLNNIYNDNINYFHRNKILLTDEIINQIEILNNKMNIVKNKLKSEYDYIMEYEEHHGTSNPQILYSYSENEVLSIKKRIENVKKIPEIENFESEIKKLRETVEKYFKELVK